MYDRDAIIAAVDLPALADELLGPHAGTDRHPSWPCPNPQHAQTGRTPPVTTFTSHRGEPRWRCHGCGDGGTAIDLVMACHHLDAGQAIRDLAHRAGHTPRPPDWHPTPRSPRPAVESPRGCRDPEGLTAYVDACARTLWQRDGTPIRQWLTQERRLPVEVLRTNRIGADLGPRRQTRPDGMCRTSGAVLPVIADGQVTYAQVRVPHPRPGRPRYLNPTSHLAPNPRLGHFRPPTTGHPEVVITEGTIDALSATAAGHRAVAVLSAGYPDRGTAHALSRIPHPLVIAFDPDDAGQEGAHRLARLLAAEHRPATVLQLEGGDLNDTLRRSHDWQHELPERIHHARAPSPLDRGQNLGR